MLLTSRMHIRVAPLSSRSRAPPTCPRASEARRADVAQTAWENRVVSAVAAAVAAAVVLVSPSSAIELHGDAPVRSIQQQPGDKSLQIRFPASRNPGIRAEQQELVEAWAYTERLFLDPTMNGVEWDTALQDALAASFNSRSPAEVQSLTDALLGSLGDPFTHIIRDDSVDAFEAETQGKVVSAGLSLGQDASGRTTVAFVASGSPADAAGLKPGDVILTVNRRPTQLQSLKDMKASLDKPADLLLVSLPRPNSASSTASLNSPTVRSVHLAPAPVAFSTVMYAALSSPEEGVQALSAPGSPEQGRAGTAGVPRQAAQHTRGLQHRVGYIRVLLWSQDVGQEVQQALSVLEREDRIDSLVIDLRDNPGGIVSAGVDVANLLMHKGDILGYVYDRSGEEEEVRLTEDAHGDGAELRLAVLVNASSASTSELLAGALHDSRGALLVGETTFGKGRMQRVIPLASAHATLFVSNTGYRTPSKLVVDKVGLHPDLDCLPETSGSMFWSGGRDTEAVSLLSDPCVKLAFDRLS